MSTPTVMPDRLEQFDNLVIDSGGHETFEEGACATEAVAWLAGEPHTDHPECLSPVLGQFLRSWNDSTDDEGRAALKPYLPRAIGTAGDGHDELRGWLCADWLIRVQTPAWLELGGCTESATALRDLPPLRELASSRQAFAELAVAARDAGATVQEIADAYGVTRPGVYEAVKAARAGADSEVNGDRYKCEVCELEWAENELAPGLACHESEER